MGNDLLIIAGEASGDLHGASLINAIKQIDSSLKFYGIGGDKMIEAGLDAQFHINKMAFLGFTEIIKHIPFIRRVQKSMLERVKKNGTKLAILIDYPGFNLSIAKKLNRIGVNIIYYISPQVWAWGGGRVKKIRRLVKMMLVVFPFEEKMYTDAGVNAKFVGHPLIKQIESYNFLSKEQFYDSFDLDKSKEILVLLPGSRKQEIEKIFPEAINAALQISDSYNLQPVIACAPNIDESIFYSYSRSNDFKIIKGHTYDILKQAKIGIIKSGTSTLEAALFELPSVVIYSTSSITYLIGKSLIRLNKIAMANIIAEEHVMEELIQSDVTSNKIYSKVAELLDDQDRYINSKNKLAKIKLKLGRGDASMNAARIIIDSFNEIK